MRPISSRSLRLTGLAGLAGVLAIGLAACGNADTTSTPAPPDSEQAAPTDDADAPAPTDDADAPADDDAEAPADGADAPAPTEPSAEDVAEAAEAAEAVEAVEAAVEGDCSAAGLDVGDPDLAGLPPEVAATVEFLLDAALRCDEQLLVTAATESGTHLMFGGADPSTYFALPEADGAPVYEAIARLLAGTTWAQADGAGPIVFPAVTTGEGTDEDWASLVASGLYTQGEVDPLRSAGDGYLGWRLGIAADGSWTFLSVGD